MRMHSSNFSGTAMKSDRPPTGSFEDASLQTLLSGARLTFGERLDWIESMIDLARRWHGQAHLDRQWLAEAPGGEWDILERRRRVAEGAPSCDLDGGAARLSANEPPHTP